MDYDKEIKQSLERMNLNGREQRLSVLKGIYASRRKVHGSDDESIEVNNHVHTRFSFSPYYPAQAAYNAWRSGLKAVGIMDHDSVAGAGEMIEACRILGIASTVGFELRVNADGTRLKGKKLNNPDSLNILYMAIHGIPSRYFGQAGDFLHPIQEVRNERNRAQVAGLNEILSSRDLQTLDYDRDILPLSMAAEGGAVTERHILFALAGGLISRWPNDLVPHLEGLIGMTVPARLRDFLSDPGNPHREYDLLGVLKTALLPRFFIQPDTRECINVRTAVDFAVQIHAIPAYAYLGDVGDSPTGDKKAEQFEDSYLPLLFEELGGMGFRAVTYMPPRNTPQQLRRVMDLCGRHGLMEISGVDINSSRQSFRCPEILRPEFSHLIDATWALIAHEKLTDRDDVWDFFDKKNILADLSLARRIELYAVSGRSIDPHTLEIGRYPSKEDLE